MDAVFFIHIEVYRMGIAFTSSQKCSMLRISTTAIAVITFQRCTDVYINITYIFVSANTHYFLRLKRRKAQSKEESVPRSSGIIF